MLSGQIHANLENVDALQHQHCAHHLLTLLCQLTVVVLVWGIQLQSNQLYVCRTFAVSLCVFLCIVRILHGAA